MLPFSLFIRMWGHAQTFASGRSYCVSFVDANSYFTWLYLIKWKSDVFAQFQVHAKHLLKHDIIHVESD
jgi:hypothetical protein